MTVWQFLAAFVLAAILAGAPAAQLAEPTPPAPVQLAPGDQIPGAPNAGPEGSKG